MIITVTFFYANTSMFCRQATLIKVKYAVTQPIFNVFGATVIACISFVVRIHYYGRLNIDKYCVLVATKIRGIMTIC